MPEKVLITGGSGLIGSRLTELLQQRQVEVCHLGRHKSKNVTSFTWDPASGSLDESCFDGVTAIIHLAGATIGGRRWTDAYKKEIVESRTRSIHLLFNALSRRKHTVKKFISASGAAWYGSGPINKAYTENALPADDFLAHVVVQWEGAASAMSSLGIKTCMVRTGLVLSTRGGALPRLMLPVKLGFGAPLGSGEQVISWIHIDDLCGIYMHLIGHDVEGPFNGVAPNSLTNRELTKSIASVLGRPLWLPAVPAWALKLFLGEMSQIVLEGAAVSSAKIVQTGFQFRFERVEDALNDVVTRRI